MRIDDDFERALKEQEEKMAKLNGLSEEHLKLVENSLAFQIKEKSLYCPSLEGNPIF